MHFTDFKILMYENSHPDLIGILEARFLLYRVPGLRIWTFLEDLKPCTYKSAIEIPWISIYNRLLSFIHVYFLFRCHLYGRIWNRFQGKITCCFQQSQTLDIFKAFGNITNFGLLWKLFKSEMELHYGVFQCTANRNFQ